MEINDSRQFDGGPDYHSSTGKAVGRSWSKVALSERSPEEAKDEPGRKWGKYTALVPVHQLARFREYNRTGQHAQKNGSLMSDVSSKDRISSIAKDLKEGGVNAMREPLSLDYSHEHKWGHLSEGHHRLEAAIQAGVTHVPVQVYQAKHLDRTHAGAPLHMDNRMQEPGSHGYFPSNLHPGNFQEFEGAR
jgi:hypothetical protein